MMYVCPDCGSQWPSHMRLLGHRGGAHGRATPPPPVHGTTARYTWERRHGQPHDQACRDANAAYQRAYRAARGQ